MFLRMAMGQARAKPAELPHKVLHAVAAAVSGDWGKSLQLYLLPNFLWLPLTGKCMIQVHTCQQLKTKHNTYSTESWYILPSVENFPSNANFESLSPYNENEINKKRNYIKTNLKYANTQEWFVSSKAFADVRLFWVNDRPAYISGKTRKKERTSIFILLLQEFLVIKVTAVAVNHRFKSYLCKFKFTNLLSLW